MKYKTCRHGHELSPDNMNSKGRCLICQRAAVNKCNNRPGKRDRKNRLRREKRAAEKEKRLTEQDRKMKKLADREYAEKLRVEQERIASLSGQQQLRTRSGRIIQPPTDMENRLFPDMDISEAKGTVVVPKKEKTGYELSCIEKLRKFNEKMVEKGFLQPSNFYGSGNHCTDIELGEL